MSLSKGPSGPLPKLIAEPAGKKGRLFVLSGPSGCGKTTLCRTLLRRKPHLKDSVSVTTRKPRPGEKNGRDYTFITKKAFRDNIRKGGFLEYAQVFGQYYGTPKKQVLAALGKGEDVILTIDVKGAAQIKRAFDKAVLIFIAPPAFEDLKKRMLKRASDGPRQMRKRLTVAKKEMCSAGMYDYIVVNDDMKTAAGELTAIVTATRCKTK